MKTSLRFFKALILAFAISGFCWHPNMQGQKGKSKFLFPYDTLKYDKVIAYDFKGEGDHQLIIHGKIQKELVLKEIALTKEQINGIHKVLGDTNTYGNTTAMCFDPHLALVYYMNNKIVGNISICLECNYLESSIDIKASEVHKIYYCDTCSNFYFARGFSKSGRKKLNDFCKSLNFSHCVDKLDGMFDN